MSTALGTIPQLWTSAEAARALGVGTSSVKRWADDGELDSVRTPGGHRRYTLAALHAFAEAHGLETSLPPLATSSRRVSLLTALTRGDASTVLRLVTPPGDALSERAAFLDETVGGVLREIGSRWERGKLGVDEEHRASHLLMEVLDRLRPVTPKGSLALLACPPGELHELPLHLVRLVLEWRGWRTEMAGADLPWDALQDMVARLEPELVAMSARSEEPFRELEWKGDVRLVAGGGWARGPGRDYMRFRTLRGFDRWLASV